MRGYRSLFDLEVPLAPLTVFVGANGSGKTNLYRALMLLARSAQHRLAATLLEEGGMPSALWAGQNAIPKRKTPVRLVLGVQLDDLGYELALGLPALGGPHFLLDPEIKDESVWVGTDRNRHSVIAGRSGVSGWTTDGDGRRSDFTTVLDPAESLLAQLSEPSRYPELFALRSTLHRWRFYHHFATDPLAPARASKPAVRTPVLADDGRDLAAALATIEDIGDSTLLTRTIETAFPGSTIEVTGDGANLGLVMHQPGMRRPVSAAELSDGTLRFLCLTAALLAPRPPGLLILNEPESSLHTDLLDALAALIAAAADRSQVIVTTHSHPLASALRAHPSTSILQLTRPAGATVLGDP